MVHHPFLKKATTLLEPEICVRWRGEITEDLLDCSVTLLGLTEGQFWCFAFPTEASCFCFFLSSTPSAKKRGSDCQELLVHLAEAFPLLAVPPSLVELPSQISFDRGR